MQPSSLSLPPPPQFAGAPGQPQYENGTTNGQGNPHMPPPPLAPVVIPQNTNPIPTAMTSPGGDSTGMLSPSGSGSFVRRAAPEPNKRALYVGGLDPRVTEDILRQIFETTGHVQNVKIIPDKNMGAVSIDTSLPAVSLEISHIVLLTMRDLANPQKSLPNISSFTIYPHPPRIQTTTSSFIYPIVVLNTSRARASITVSSNTTIQLQQNAPCRPSMAVAYIKRSARIPCVLI